jgi:hypothetical protein
MFLQSLISFALQTINWVWNDAKRCVVLFWHNSKQTIDLLNQQILQLNTATALDSDSWLGISLESLLEFLRMNNIDAVEEADLVKALIRWGKFQVKLDGDQLDGKNLRSKILPGLHLIRFSALTSKQFANLCFEELGLVLSADERHSILMSIVTENSLLMPPAVVVNNNPARKRKASIVLKLQIEKSKYLHKNGPFSSKLLFQLKKKATLAGFRLKIPQNVKHFFTFKLRTLDVDEVVWEGSSDKDLSSYSGVDFYKIRTECSLQARTGYILTISNPCVKQGEMFTIKKYKLLKVTSDKLTLEFSSYEDFSIVEAMVFVES